MQGLTMAHRTIYSVPPKNFTLTKKELLKFFPLFKLLYFEVPFYTVDKLMIFSMVRSSNFITFFFPIFNAFHA